MKIAAVLKFSILDYPGKLSTVVFCQGCPYMCVYCHNSKFQDQNQQGAIKFSDFLQFLNTRMDLLDAVVFSGGEPLMQPDLYEKMSIVKDMGFLIGLHTSGSYPNAFEKVLKIVDWVGFDIKTTRNKYMEITGIADSGYISSTSLNKLINSGVDYEIRTTVDSRHISEDDLRTIAKYLHKQDVKKWILQECILRNDGENLKMPLPSMETIGELSKLIEVELRKQ